MNSIVSFILPYLLLYKYWAIFSITFVAALAFPVPPGTLLMASSAFASQGYFYFPWVVLSGIAGNIAGDNVGYFIAKEYGKKILYAIGFRNIINSSKYAALENRIKKGSGFIIFISRFEVVSNLAVNIICGLSGMEYRNYVFYEVIGEILQVTLYCAIGYFVGDEWVTISALISKFLLLIILIAALLIAVYWKKIWRSIAKE